MHANSRFCICILFYSLTLRWLSDKSRSIFARNSNWPNSPGVSLYVEINLFNCFCLTMLQMAKSFTRTARIWNSFSIRDSAVEKSTRAILERAFRLLIAHIEVERELFFASAEAGSQGGTIGSFQKLQKDKEIEFESSHLRAEIKFCFHHPPKLLA